MADKNIKKITQKMKKALDQNKKEYAKNLLRIIVKDRGLFEAVNVDLFTDLMHLVFTEEQINQSDIVICQGMGEWHAYFIDELNDMMRGVMPDNPLLDKHISAEGAQKMRDIMRRVMQADHGQKMGFDSGSHAGSNAGSGVKESVSQAKIGNKNAEKTGFFAKNIMARYEQSALYDTLVQEYQTYYAGLKGSLDDQLIKDMALIKVRQNHLWEAKSHYLYNQQLKALQDLDIVTRATQGRIANLPHNAQKYFIQFKNVDDATHQELCDDARTAHLRWIDHYREAQKKYQDFFGHYLDDMTASERNKYDHKKRFLSDRLAYAADRLAEAETLDYALCGLHEVWAYIETIQWVGTGHWKDFEREEGRLQRAFEAKKRLLDAAVKEKRQAAKLALSFSRVLVKEANNHDYAFDLTPLLEKMEAYMTELIPDSALKRNFC